MMKNLFLIALLSVSTFVYSQEKQSEFKPSGKAFGKVFFNYHYDMTEGTNKANTFAIQRSYLGYEYSLSEDISTKITLDVGPVGAGSKYTAFLKTAQLDWKVASPVKLSLGLIGLKQFNDQEKWWGYRYIYKSFQDEFAFGSSADLGFNAEIKLLEGLKANVFVLNGEGYKKVQDEMGNLKTGANLVYTPVDGLIFKGYFDVYGGKVAVNDTEIVDTASVKTAAIFAGYKTDKFRIGAEYNLQLDGKKYYQQAADHDLTGIAIYGSLILNKQFELFANYMDFQSNKLDGASQTWNYNKDGSVVIAGLQYAPVKGLKLALNYRSLLYDNPDKNTGNLLYLNFEYKF